MSTADVNRFYCVDLDRTILNTRRASGVIIELCRAYDEQLAETIEREVVEYSYFGASYSVHDAIVRYASSEVADNIERQFIEAARTQSLKLPGADELISWLDELDDAQWGILTYGSLNNQLMKVKALGLETRPVLVTQEPHKGTLIKGWYDKSSSGFGLPKEYSSVRAKEVILIDDRAQSFEGLPESAARGYWVTQEAVDVMDAIPVPPGVVAVHDLTDVIRSEIDR
ncbi:hypothetical protein B7Z17_00090 [Candidatus Saccharibacteria bacterium 32-49-10]|nr:MAG: hypothetical protein B7Z17_00090 [Candidatus Saccharibacteria bacterium 32-49-10]